jgi:hypothetical protein
MYSDCNDETKGDDEDQRFEGYRVPFRMCRKEEAAEERERREEKRE